MCIPSATNLWQMDYLLIARLAGYGVSQKALEDDQRVSVLSLLFTAFCFISMESGAKVPC